MTQPDLEKINAHWRSAPGEWAGLMFTRVEQNTWFAHFTVKPNLLQPFGLLHGGVICLIAETVGSVASASLVDANNFHAVGQTLHATYFRPGLLNQEISIQATLEHAGKRSHVWQIDFAEQHLQKRIARVQFIVAIVPKDR